MIMRSYRQPALKALFDPTQVSQGEARAQQHELAYVALEGDIGCMVNGAGLAMATMDLIHHFGGRPANFSMWKCFKSCRRIQDYLV